MRWTRRSTPFKTNRVDAIGMPSACPPASIWRPARLDASSLAHATASAIEYARRSVYSRCNSLQLDV
ncbi:MAG: hypothetical protein ACXWC3_30775, partial [Burkholderiales bacterium]